MTRHLRYWREWGLTATGPILFWVVDLCLLHLPLTKYLVTLAFVIAYGCVSFWQGLNVDPRGRR